MSQRKVRLELDRTGQMEKAGEGILMRGPDLGKAGKYGSMRDPQQKMV